MPTSFTFIKEGQNVNTSMNSQDLIVFVPDESDTEGCIKKLIQWFNQRKRTDKQYWLIDITYLSTINEKTNEILNDLKLDLDDDLFMFAYSSTGIELYEAYKIHENFDATVKPYGFWSFNNGLTSPMYGKWIRRKNMQGAKLNVVSNVQPPYVTQMIPVGSTTYQITQDYSPGEFEFKGMYADVFLELQNMLNFTFVLKKSPDGQWGTLRSDGTWTGMIRELQDQRVDIGNLGNQKACLLNFLVCNYNLSEYLEIFLQQSALWSVELLSSKFELNNSNSSNDISNSFQLQLVLQCQ